MRNPEEELISLLRQADVDFTSSLPCEKIKRLLDMVAEGFCHVPLTREEEGVGISAGASLSGKRPAMFVQSSGIGNMINALLSLTAFYELPLAIFVSQRGVYKERIEAQLPMGERLPAILKGAGIPFSIIRNRDDFGLIEKRLPLVYKKNTVHAFLLSPAIWEGSSAGEKKPAVYHPISGIPYGQKTGRVTPRLTRYSIIEVIAPYLEGKVVVCNLGIPSKELFQIRHQPSNFYMLGSMGMATPVGLGISLSSQKDVVVIDGDGSILMNPGTLATAAYCNPKNLTILAIDNSAYGSTGSQQTLTGSCADLGLMAKGAGIRHVVRAATERQFNEVMREKGRRLRFIHALALSGNSDAPNITLHHLENKRLVQEVIRS